jgi:hypothetical protein
MPIELTIAQAKKVAELADELSGSVSLHQLADGEDVYLALAGEENRYLISADGAARDVDADAGGRGADQG